MVYKQRPVPFKALWSSLSVVLLSQVVQRRTKVTKNMLVFRLRMTTINPVYKHAKKCITTVSYVIVLWKGISRSLM